MTATKAPPAAAGTDAGHKPRRFRWNVAVGPRTVLALTCLTCGELRQGWEFGRRWRGVGAFHSGRVAYLDRRCKKCRWKHIEDARGGAGRNE